MAIGITPRSHTTDFVAIIIIIITSSNHYHEHKILIQIKIQQQEELSRACNLWLPLIALGAGA